MFNEVDIIVTCNIKHLFYSIYIWTAATKCSGNRADQFPSGNLFVAVSEGLLDNGAACGRRYRLKCLSGNNRPCKEGTIDVRVVDYCTKRPCPSTIVLSSDAFAEISHSHNAKINIEYVQI
ncbi:EG45-like domain containing protein 2 [Lycium barbarum]|uniref:EG45-like domain containing protein 2 n=1 Tax=Lycium barbarum TaxID=112863 RepID=UPI00293E03E8|nr:EG45-like domain containing protein 2 [Lycium barbarum]